MMINYVVACETPHIPELELALCFEMVIGVNKYIVQRVSAVPVPIELVY